MAVLNTTINVQMDESRFKPFSVRGCLALVYFPNLCRLNDDKLQED
ncbi:MAG: hypothetical protein WBP16_06385 [Ferruginibacter sp.]